ncbi:MAG: hypothetical protein IJH48_08205, partial [Oscillospiraceae bacterium]|nr:hypothetical protein [Oscillospiraceae bacterium]
VEEPVIEEPVVEEPVVEEPAVEEPAVEEPVVEEPVVEEPAVEEPVVEEPVVEEPAVEESVIEDLAVPAAPASSGTTAALAALGGVSGREIVHLTEEKEYPAAPLVEEILANETPLNSAAANIENSGSCWALLNLLLLGLSAYAFLPILTLRRKLERVRKLGENGRFALAVEALIVAIALVAFLSMQDLSAPMVIADALTLPMAFLSAALLAIEYGMRRADSASRANA